MSIIFLLHTLHCTALHYMYDNVPNYALQWNKQLVTLLKVIYYDGVNGQPVEIPH